MIKLSLVKSIRKPYQPIKSEVLAYLKKSLINEYSNVYINVIIVSLEKSQKLNLQYRGIDKPTNVIALEYKDSRENFNLLHGELILCDEIIVKEADTQKKLIKAHYAHMIVHGILHIQGLDHQTRKEAVIMEDLEIKILKEIGISNPYI